MKASSKLLLVAAGAILFNLVFWQEKLAVNAVLFDLFILGAVYYLQTGAFETGTSKWLLFAHLITVCAVILLNTELSKIAFCSTLLLLVIFTQYVHRSVWYAAGSIVMNYIMVPKTLSSNLSQIRIGEVSFYEIKRSVRFLLIPVLLLGTFFLLYNFSNAVFQDIMIKIQGALSNYFSKFFQWFSWERTGFLVLGFFITAGLLLKSHISFFCEADNRRPDSLWRKKNDIKKWKQSSWFELLTLLMGKFAGGTLALRNENTTAMISLALLNILLLFINSIDIAYVWFGFKYTGKMNLSEYVHEGTGVLIFSILLAIVVLLFFFRGNLNFYQKNKWLRLGAYAWLIQNAVLVISVLFRDYYYIVHYGLAYKRIGVLIFLAGTLFGLVTVFIKIHRKKTAYYLLRVNAWFAIILLVVCSCIHWDEQIAGYNLARKQTIMPDVKFLLTLSDKTLPLLEANKDLLSNPPLIKGGEGQLLYRSELSPLQVFEKRKHDFFIEQNAYSWLSWNFADASTMERLKNPAGIALLHHESPASVYPGYYSYFPEVLKVCYVGLNP